MTYVPPPPPDDEQAIFARYQTGMNFDKYDENVVEVSGLDPPTALMVSELIHLTVYVKHDLQGCVVGSIFAANKNTNKKY